MYTNVQKTDNLMIPILIKVKIIEKMAWTTSVSRRIAAAAKKNELKIRKAAIETYCKSIHEVFKTSRNNRLPYGFMMKFVQENKKNSSWLTQAMMNSAWKRYKQNNIDVQNSERKPSEIYLSRSTTSLSSSLSDLSDSQTSNKGRMKGGRPLGTTLVNQKKREEQIVMMKNDITQGYKREVEMAKKMNRRVRNGILMDIIQKHKKRRGLKVHIPLSTIRQRVVRKKLIINNHHCGGNQSPLAPIESIVVGILCQMSRLRECLQPSRELCPINLLIEDQPI